MFVLPFQVISFINNRKDIQAFSISVIVMIIYTVKKSKDGKSK